MNFLSRLALLLIAGATLALSAEATSIRRTTGDTQVWIPPRLVIPTRTDLPVTLQSVKIRSEVSGRLAFTELEMAFFNPNARILEGELQFPLLDGQSIASFAMDVNGALREAVPVDKAKGQQVFEDVIRGRIDPGLLEVTQGNNFKLRVYPIPANGIKRVVLRINETLRDSGGRTHLRIPLEYAERVQDFVFDLDLRGAAALPTGVNSSIGPIRFNAAGDSYRAQVARKDFAGRGVLSIDFARRDAPQVTTQIFDGKTYFYADLPFPAKSAPRRIPQRVSLVWDSSGSGAGRDHLRELGLLDGYFKRMGNGEVRLTLQRETTAPAQVFRIVNGNWRALRDTLATVAYDGATNLAAYQHGSGHDSAGEEVLLFSDGLSNYGDALWSASPVPVYTISSAAKADHAWLRWAAHQNGGRFIDLAATSTAEALALLTTAVSRVSHVDGSGIGDIVMASPYAVNGRLTLAGRLGEAAPVLRLNVIHPNERAASIELSLATQRHGSTAAALWARQRIAALEADYELNRGEIRRLGRGFGLVTRETSLIVLDRIEDYVRFEIAPPVPLLAEYQRLSASVATARGVERKQHLDNIVRLFDDKLAWWNREYPKYRLPRKEAKVEVTGSRISENRQEVGAALQIAEIARRDAPAAGAPAAPPAPALAAPRAKAVADAVAPLEKRAGDSRAPTTTIQLQKWQPDAPYSARMQAAAPADLYRIYLDEKPGYANSTAFFLDMADLLLERDQRDLGLRVLSNLAEMDLENRHILRVLGYRLLQAKAPRLAIPVLKRVLALSPEEPQSYRDLGLAYAADKQTQKAVDTLYEVVIRPWHGRFPEIELITLADLNAVVATAADKPDISRIDPRLTRNLPLDLRVVLTWDADNTDIDLWVTDPNGDKAYYGRRMTDQGGRMSLDFTGGYGPEEFSLKRALPGKYKVEANYFGDRRQNLTGPTTLQVKFATHFGTPEQKEETVTMRLKGQRETVFVGEFEVKP